MRKTTNPILNFRIRTEEEKVQVTQLYYSLARGTHVKMDDHSNEEFNYSTMLTKTREAIDSTENSFS